MANLQGRVVRIELAESGYIIELVESVKETESDYLVIASENP